MDEHLAPREPAIDAFLGQLDALIRRGRQVRATREVDAIRAWQQDCAAAINHLSGGSKAHWLARAYSGAFLVRSTDDAVVLEADAMEIVDRILGVLAQGVASLSRVDDVAAASSGAAPRPRRFEFVHNAELRPVLEQAFADSRGAFERREFGLALILSCGVIEAVLTDALDHAAPAHDRREGRMADWSFETRIAAAERAGLIRGGCTRLPPVARKYGDLTDADGELRADATVSERDARLAGQVLRVVMRDLDPGR
jgi:hypothetical protein